VIEAVRPISQGEDAAGLMLGGDVAGYAAADNTSQPDNQVTLADWDFVAAFFGRNSETLEAQIRADITGDGLVNVQDLALVGANFLLNGPRPVFKEMKVPQALPIFALEAEFGGLNAGKEKLFWLTGDGLEGMQAFQAGLHFFSGEWEVVEVGTDGMLELWWPLVDGQQPLGDREEWEDAGRPWKDTEVAAKVDGGELAASLRGRGASLAQRSVLARWRLRALVDRPQTPWLAGGLLVDQEGRAVKPRLTGAEQVHTLPLEFHLKQNKPNPFNPMTAIDFAVPAYQQRLRLEVYNVLGQRVATLWDGPLAAGSHSMIWNGLDQAGKGVASGVYLYQLQGDGVRYMRRMLLLR
jgi:hypothetical protein